MNKIKIQDDSGDKKYFTIVPNYILNHSTPYDRDLYIQIKRITGENRTCWVSQKNLAKQCNVSINRLKKSIKYLLENKWIDFIGKKQVNTKGGEQEVLEYRIIDLWDLNNSFYTKGVSRNDTPNTKGVSRGDEGGYHEMTKGVSRGDDKEEPLNNINNEEELYSRNFEKFLPYQNLILKYLEIRDIENKTNQRILKTIANKMTLEELELLLKGIKYFDTTEYPYVIYSLGSLWQKKEKIIARMKQTNLHFQNKKGGVAQI